jgi:polyphosphate kinase
MSQAETFAAEPLAATPAASATFAPSELFINRELSLLEFNRRVLEQAKDPRVPLLERLRFLCISCANLDEFFEIRVAGIKQVVKLGNAYQSPEGMSANEVLAAISQCAHALVAEQYLVLNEQLIPALEQQRIRFIRRADWTAEQDAWLHGYFQNEVLPVLSPIGLDPAHPFPRILNKSLNFIVSLAGKDAFGRNIDSAIVQAPRALPRLIRLPREVPGSGPDDFVFLSSVIHAYVTELFPGMETTGCYQFRVTRNSDLLVDEAEADDLLEELEDVLSQRQWGDTVRLEVAHTCPDPLAHYLVDELALSRADVYECNGPVNLMRLMTVPDLVDRPDLKYVPFTPRQPKALSGDLFAAMSRGDQLLQHPYDSFLPVLELLRQAARDPNVLAIKQTLYRTGAKSPVAEALIAAARAGKEVTVVVELRARFDEADNISLAEALQEVGAHVVYGVVGYKTHAKMMLIVRREEGRLKHYAHLGTGNYHPKTARIYTDYGLMTADPAICKDVHALFLQLTSLGRVTQLNRLLQSPFTLARGFHERIEREAQNAAAGKPARIIAKLNGLVEPETIQTLYRASRAGVQIDLIVRGMCSLRPGVPGLSDNIRVRSIIGRFLEHQRVLYFQNGSENAGDAPSENQPEVWLSSADWMERNLFKRVEIAFPVLDPRLRARIVEQLHSYLDDQAQSWLLQPDGSYLRAEAPPGARGVQERLLEESMG